MVVMAPRQHWLHSWQIVIGFVTHAKNENFIGSKLFGVGSMGFKETSYFVVVPGFGNIER
jgi:hypothetical protein